MTDSGFERAPAARRRLPGPLPLRLRAQLRARAAATCAALTGPAPLLPRKAFGVWFSKLVALQRRRLARAASTASGPSASRSTRSRSTPTSSAVHDPVGGAVAATAVGAPGRPVLVERVGLEPRPVPRPAGLPALGARERARDGPEPAPVDQQHRPALRRDAVARRRRAEGRRRVPHDPGRHPRDVHGLRLGRPEAARRVLRPARAVRARRHRLLVAGLVLRRQPRRRPGPDAGHLDQQAATSSASAPAARAGRRSSASAARSRLGFGGSGRRPARSPSTATRSSSPATRARRGRSSASRRSSRRRRRASACRT